MLDIGTPVARTSLSPLRLGLLCVVFAPLCFALALLEAALLGAVGLSVEQPPYIALLTSLNLILLALIFVRSGHLERWWFAAGVALNIVLAVLAYSVVLKAPLGEIASAPMTLPNALPDVLRPAPPLLPALPLPPPLGAGSPAPPPIPIPRAEQQAQAEAQAQRQAEAQAERQARRQEEAQRQPQAERLARQQAEAQRKAASEAPSPRIAPDRVPVSPEIGVALPPPPAPAAPPDESSRRRPAESLAPAPPLTAEMARRPPILLPEATIREQLPQSRLGSAAPAPSPRVGSPEPPPVASARPRPVEEPLARPPAPPPTQPVARPTPTPTPLSPPIVSAQSAQTGQAPQTSPKILPRVTPLSPNPAITDDEPRPTAPARPSAVQQGATDAARTSKSLLPSPKAPAKVAAAAPTAAAPTAAAPTTAAPTLRPTASPRIAMGGSPPPDPPQIKPAAISAPPAGGSAYWNTWFVDGTGPASNRLIAGNTYAYSLDLSAFKYALLRKVAQSSSVDADSRLKDVLASGISEVVLDIKPVIPEGSGLRLVDDTTRYSMKVGLGKIRIPDGDAAQQYADGKISISELSKRVAAGSVQIPVFADAQGCATIAFSIFNGMRPLDHLVQRVAIGESSTSAPLCDENDPEQSGALSGGLDSLREVALGMEGSGPSLLAAGALHIFDSAITSMVVFVDGRPGQAQSVYGWQTDSSVVDYLKTDNFQNLIMKARRDSANNTPGSYVKAAQDLSQVLFVAKPGTAAEARKAKAAFQSLVRESQAAPVIVVRVASSRVEGQNRSIYVPLGILGARGDGAVLDKPIVIVQPMAIERYAPSSKCIGDWTFAVPNKLQDVPDETMPDDFFPAKYPGTRILDIAHLKPYLASAPAAPVRAFAQAQDLVGLVVLAHHDEGFLWFDESTDPIMQQDIARDFPSGSVGIFAACSAAAPKGRNTAILQKLNERGMGTIIASPFPIDAAYGVTFASSFAEVLEATIQKKETPTILELFNGAISRTGQKFSEKNHGDYAELGLEYVLLGNPAITLCIPATTPGPQ